MDMMGELSIRPADEHDLPDVLRLLAQPAMDDGNVVTPEQARSIYRAMRRVPDYVLHVAEYRSETVGTFALLIMPNLGHCGSPSGILEGIVVADRWRRQGVGRAMVEHALETCRDHGCYKMVLSSNLCREEAHGFYEHLGFEHHGYSFRVML